MIRLSGLEDQIREARDQQSRKRASLESEARARGDRDRQFASDMEAALLHVAGLLRRSGRTKVWVYRQCAVGSTTFRTGLGSSSSIIWGTVDKECRSWEGWLFDGIPGQTHVLTEEGLIAVHKALMPGYRVRAPRKQRGLTLEEFRHQLFAGAATTWCSQPLPLEGQRREDRAAPTSRPTYIVQSYDPDGGTYNYDYRHDLANWVVSQGLT